MPVTHDAYLTDVAYPAHFHREMMPQWIHATLTSLGIDAPNTHQTFKWLELGCGLGINLLAAAAQHPQAHFVGVDVSARGIAQAQHWAQICGITNVQLICQDFAASPQTAPHNNDHTTQSHDASSLTNPAPWLRDDAFDFIVTHGVYSWVSARHREAIHNIIARSLKPLGVAYVAYNSQPGAATFSPHNA